MPKMCLLLCLLAAVSCAQQLPQAPPASNPSLAAARRRQDRFLEQHRFFDKTNIALQGWNVAAETYDAITTRRDLNSPRINELNPFGGIFVNHGWGGQLLFSYGFGVGGPLLTSYLLHRTGHHKMERWVSITHLSVTAFGDAHNYALKTHRPH